MDLTKVIVWVDDTEALRRVLDSGDFSQECGRPQREDDGSYRVVLYGPKAAAKRLARLGVPLEIDDSFGDFLAARQKEVSRKDRFRGGKVAPKGLGDKY